MMDDGTLQAVGDAMDASALRHQVLAGNIANARTPGYRARDVSFARLVDGARAPQVVEQGGPVDTQRAVAQMTENAVRYQSLAQLATAHLHILASIAHDGRR
jgi:flagellar basal-body rod protein FlgB